MAYSLRQWINCCCGDNIKLFPDSLLIRPIYKSILENEKNPVIVIENKADYAKKITKANVEIISLN